MEHAQTTPLRLDLGHSKRSKRKECRAFFYRENDSVDDAVQFGFDPRTRKSIRRLTQARTAVHEMPSYYF